MRIALAKDGIGLGKYSEGWDDFLPKEEGSNV